MAAFGDGTLCKPPVGSLKVVQTMLLPVLLMRIMMRCNMKESQFVTGGEDYEHLPHPGKKHNRRPCTESIWARISDHEAEITLHHS